LIDTNRLSPRTDLVVISGGIAPALPEKYEHAKTLLGSAGEQAVLEFEPRWPEVFKIEPQALHLHEWLPRQGIRKRGHTHSVPTGEFPSLFLWLCRYGATTLVANRLF
jgi:hypothetical protein